MLSTKEMRKKRAGLIGEARAILDRAVAEGRALAPAESERFDELLDEADEMQKDIGRRDRLGDEEHELAAVQPRRTSLQMADEGPDGGSASEGAEKWRDVATGRVIPVLGREQRFTDLPEARRGGFDPEALSLGRVIAAVARGDWTGAEAEKRAMSGGVATAGGFLVAEPVFAQVIDQVRARSVLVEAGMKTVPMTAADLVIARLEADPTVETKGENAAFTERTLAFGAVRLGARTVGVLVALSRELAADALNAPQMVEQTIAKALAAKVDALGLAGAGGLDPLGVTNHPDVQTDAEVGAIGWDKVLDAIELVENENIEPSAYIAPPAVKTFLAKLKDGEGQYDCAPPQAKAMKRLVTTAATAGTLVLGGFESLLMGLRQDAMAEISTEAGDAFKKHQVLVKITIRLDFALEWPRHIVVMSGITS